MANPKESNWQNPLAKTEPAPTWPEDNSDLDSGNVRASGVGLKDGEITALDEIAKKFNISRNILIRRAVRQFILDYRAGKVDLKIKAKPPKREIKNTLEMPR